MIDKDNIWFILAVTNYFAEKYCSDNLQKAYQILKEKSILSQLADGYEVLHTQSFEYLEDFYHLSSLA